MIEQKATVISRDGDQVWLEAERQSTCSQCQVKKGCGTGLLAKHVGKRFSRIAVAADNELQVGQEVTVAIPEQALLSGAFLMYMMPLLLMFAAAALVRVSGAGELAEIVAGLSGLMAGFYWVRTRLKNRNTGMQVKITEDFK
jgi:sigma-E factor negative regulatory protein RseC